MLRHIANLGLLLCFGTLAMTGVMSFVQPFSITTTRIHVVFGLATTVLVGLHLATRWRYFLGVAKQVRQPTSKANPWHFRWLLISITAVWAALLVASLYDAPPASGLIAVSYESRHKAEIFRANPRTTYEHVQDQTRILQRQADADAVQIEVLIDYTDDLTRRPAAAVWSETTRGTLIETLFLDERLAFSENPEWGGKPTPRVKILPIWRHRYSLINGVEPNGEVDALTSATPMHSFSFSEHLQTDADSVVVCLEINLAADIDPLWQDGHIGQPSVLYTALIDLTRDQNYYLMQLTGHGGGADASGTLNYDLDKLTTARSLIDKVLVKVVR